MKFLLFSLCGLGFLLFCPIRLRLKGVFHWETAGKQHQVSLYARWGCLGLKKCCWKCERLDDAELAERLLTGGSGGKRSPGGLLSLAEGLRIRELRIGLAVGCGNAGHTAVVSGLLWNLRSAAALLRGRFPVPDAVHFRVQPWYDRVGCCVEAECIISLRTAQIIRSAGILFRAKRRKRRAAPPQIAGQEATV